MLLGAACCVSLAGCGDGAEGAADRVDVYPVTGKVTFAGAPVTDALVTFSPKSGQPPAIGRTDKQGVYTLTTYEPEDGAAAGDFVAMVTKETVKAENSGPIAHDPNNPYQPQAHGGGPSRVTTTSLLPKKYSSATESDLNVTVKDGKNTIDLDLKP